MMGGGIIFITVHIGRRNGGPRGAELDPRDRHRVEEEGEQQIEQRIRAAADVHTAILRVYIYVSFFLLGARWWGGPHHCGKGKCLHHRAGDAR